MINYDENGIAVSADSVEDVVEALSEIESALSKANKSNSEDMSDEDKSDLVIKMNNLKALLGMVTPEMQKSAKPMEMLKYLKQVMKIKDAAEKFQKNHGDIGE